MSRIGRGRRAFVHALAAGALLCASAPAAQAAPEPAAVRSYDVRADGAFWNGQSIHEDLVLRVTPRTGTAVDVTETGANVDITSDGHLESGGSIATARPIFSAIYVDQLIDILRAAPRAFAHGASWQAAIRITTAPAVFMTIPVHVRSRAAANGAVIVDVDGAQSGNVTYSGITLPADVVYRATMTFARDAFKEAVVDVKENVRADFSTQKMWWTVRITPSASCRDACRLR